MVFSLSWSGHSPSTGLPACSAIQSSKDIGFPVFCCHEYSRFEYRCTLFCMNICFLFSGINAQKCICWGEWQPHVSFRKKLLICLPERLYRFTSCQQRGDTQFLHICCSIWCCDDSWVFALLIGAKRGAAVGVACICLVADDAERLFSGRLA